MTPVVRNRVIAIGALLVAGAGLAVISFSKMGDNLVYYWTPAEMIAQGPRAFGPTIRLGGIVQANTIKWDDAHTKLSFRVASDKTADAPSVLVNAAETPPQMFREGIGVVVEGTFDQSQTFTSNRLMVKHSNEYRPPKPGDAPHDWKDSVSEGSTAKAEAK